MMFGSTLRSWEWYLILPRTPDVMIFCESVYLIAWDVNCEPQVSHAYSISLSRKEFESELEIWNK